MKKIRVYHATDVKIGEIGIEKKTMFFTSSLELAKMWGDERYKQYHIITTMLPLEQITEFKPTLGREQFVVSDFEQLENTDLFCEILHCEDANSGYIVGNISKYELSYL